METSRSVMDDFFRLRGCVLTSAPASPLVQVPSLRLEEEGLSVQDSLLRPLHCPTSFHSNLCGSGSTSPLPGDQTSEVLGRLATSGFLLPDLPSAEEPTSLIMQKLRLKNKFQKVQHRTHSIKAYLGMLLSSTLYRAFPTEKRQLKFRSFAQNFLLTQLPVKAWETLLGMMSSLLDLVVGGRLRMRPLQFRLQEMKALNLPEETDYTVPSECIDAINWCLVPGRLEEGVSLHQPTPSFSLETDASGEGWRAHLQGIFSSGIWSQQESSLHINQLELRAVLKALQAIRTA